jgi:hypothetical protein
MINTKATPNDISVQEWRGLLVERCDYTNTMVSSYSAIFGGLAGLTRNVGVLFKSRWRIMVVWMVRRDDMVVGIPEIL